MVGNTFSHKNRVVACMVFLNFFIQNFQHNSGHQTETVGRQHAAQEMCRGQCNVTQSEWIVGILKVIMNWSLHLTLMPKVLQLCVFRLYIHVLAMNITLIQAWVLCVSDFYWYTGSYKCRLAGTRFTMNSWKS